MTVVDISLRLSGFYVCGACVMAVRGQRCLRFGHGLRLGDARGFLSAVEG